MKKVVGALVTVVFIIVVLVSSVFIDDDDDETQCEDPASSGSSSSSDGAGDSVAANADGLAEPLGEGTLDHVTSQYKSPDRPGHRGIDIAKEDGHPIYSMADGTVVQAGEASGFGMWVIVAHDIDGEHWETVYGHIFPEGIHVSAGDKVKAGQHIADQGWNGEVYPSGPDGSHLHIEWWQGGRDTGTESNPMPWLERAAEGGGDTSSSDDNDSDRSDSGEESTDSAPAPDSDDEDSPSDSDSSTSRSGSGKEMPDSDKIQNQDKLQVDSVRVARAVAEVFPEVETIGGWRAQDDYPDHPSGRAVDVMIPDWDSDKGRKLGEEVKDYVYSNRDHFNVEYLIWRQQYIPAEGDPNQMEDRGDPTENHYDHVHITTDGGGMPQEDQKYGSAPDAAGKAPTSDDNGDGCIPEGVSHVDDAYLAAGEVPDEFVKWLKLGGRECKGISSPLLAAQMQQESGFQKEIGSPAGAYGPSQFMPGTWQTWGYKVDDEGKSTGEAGAGDITDPADATMAQARLMCANWETAERKIDNGTWSGDPVELTLASYNAGEGNVDNYGGVPPFAETQHYVKVIPDTAEQFEEKV